MSRVRYWLVFLFSHHYVTIYGEMAGFEMHFGWEFTAQLIVNWRGTAVEVQAEI